MQFRGESLSHFAGCLQLSSTRKSHENHHKNAGMESENVVSLTGGTIADLIQEKKEYRKGNWPILSETDSLGYLEDVLKAVKFLHSKGIVHRDIKGNMKTEFSCFTLIGSSHSHRFPEELAN